MANKNFYYRVKTRMTEVFLLRFKPEFIIGDLRHKWNKYIKIICLGALNLSLTEVRQHRAIATGVYNTH